MIFLGILAIGFGILMMVARDFFWALTEMGNSFAGRQSERTELWEAGQMISGIIFILIGAFAICSGAAEAQEQEARRVAPTQTAVALEAFSETLNSEFAEFIPQWERSIETGVQMVRPASIGVRADGITYGRCEDGRFFIAIQGYGGRYYEDFLYLPEGDPVTCDNGALNFFGGTSANVDWRRVTMVNDYSNPVSMTATIDTMIRTILTTPTPRSTAEPETPTAEVTIEPEAPTAMPTERPAATATRRPRQ